MWTVTGPFDGSGELDLKKTKLLRPGCTYVAGRKDCHLVIRHPKVSRKHCVLAVSEFSEEDVENPSAIPKITLINAASGNRKVEHADGTESVINPEGSAVLRDGDTIRVIHDAVITVKWEKIVCYTPPSSLADARECAKLGIHTCMKPEPDVTHHLTPTYSLSPAIAISLLTAATLVKPDWLTNLITHYSIDPADGTAQEYYTPVLSKFRPIFSPALPSSLKNYKSWEPNEARLNMFSGKRVVFVGERGREASEDLKELVRRGGATYECCAVQGGRKAVHDVLAKGKGKGAEITLIADEAAMVAAVGQDSWDEVVKDAATFGLRFLPPEKLVLAVAHVEVSHIDSQISGAVEGTMMPDVILNTHPSEPSMVPPSASAQAEADDGPAPPRKKLIRRMGSRASSRAPSVPPEPQPATGPSGGLEALDDIPKPRRPLKRRIVQKPAIVGIDDTTIMDDDSVISEDKPSDAKAAEEPPPPPSLPTPSFRPSRLKRRFAGGGTQAPSHVEDKIEEEAEEEEPPHKKFKALFEQSDPDRISQAQSGAGASITQFESQTQPPSATTQSKPRSALAVVAEEEEEGTQARSQRKRKSADSDDDVDMDDGKSQRSAKRRKPSSTQAPQTQRAASRAPSAGPSQAPPTTQPAASRVFSSKTNTTQTQKSTGAVTGQPDTDEAFLKAVASTKKGKKHEDDFDREFNNLRISKPDVRAEEAANEEAVLAEFGDDTNIRGNFMVIMEMDVFRKEDASRSVLRTAGGRLDWEGRPNFKKFKKKSQAERPRPVELFLDPQVIENTQNVKSEDQGDFTPHYRSNAGNVVSDDDEEEIIHPRTARQRRTQTQQRAMASPKARPTRAGSRQPTTQQASTSKKPQVPLFLEEEDEMMDDPEAGMDEAESIADANAVASQLGRDEDFDSLAGTMRTYSKTQESKGRRRNRNLVYEDE